MERINAQYEACTSQLSILTLLVSELNKSHALKLTKNDEKRISEAKKVYFEIQKGINLLEKELPVLPRARSVPDGNSVLLSRDELMFKIKELQKKLLFQESILETIIRSKTTSLSAFRPIPDTAADTQTSDV